MVQYSNNRGGWNNRRGGWKLFHTIIFGGWDNRFHRIVKGGGGWNKSGGWKMFQN